MYHFLEYVMFMSCNDVLYVVYYYTVNVGCCVVGSVVHGNRQQCLVAEWLGLSVTVRVRVRARARECIFPFFFFLSLLKVAKIFVLRISGNCDIHGVRTTTVRDVKKMYSQEQYMENVPVVRVFGPRMEEFAGGVIGLAVIFPPSKATGIGFVAPY